MQKEKLFPDYRYLFTTKLAELQAERAPTFPLFLMRSEVYQAHKVIAAIAPPAESSGVYRFKIGFLAHCADNRFVRFQEQHTYTIAPKLVDHPRDTNIPYADTLADLVVHATALSRLTFMRDHLPSLTEVGFTDIATLKPFMKIDEIAPGILGMTEKYGLAPLPYPAEQTRMEVAS